MTSLRRRLLCGLVFVALLLASAAQVFLSRRENQGAAVVLLTVALVLTLVAFRRLSVDEGQQEQQPRSNWDRQGMAALLVASLPAWVAGCLLAVRWDSLYTGLLLYAAGFSLVAVACAHRERWRLPALSTLKDHWLELTLVGLVLALGLFLGVYRLDYYPPPAASPGTTRRRSARTPMVSFTTVTVPGSSRFPCTPPVFPSSCWGPRSWPCA
jgi:hypothetical protein